MGIEEPFSWNKFIQGIIAPLNFAKSFVFLIQASIIILIILSLIFSGLWLKKKLLKKDIQGSVNITSNSGQVHSSADTFKNKFGINIL